MSIHYENLNKVTKICQNEGKNLLIVTKNQEMSDLETLYELGFRDFGENKPQELVRKAMLLPKDIRWHAIGHIQTNKLKSLLPYVHAIHSVDRWSILEKLLSLDLDREIDLYIEIKVAKEETKHGFPHTEIETICNYIQARSHPKLRWRGIMAMASFTSDEALIDSEFQEAFAIFTRFKKILGYACFDQCSMGMSGDYEIALRNHATLIRIGSLFFT
ncbi:MAG: YggS family pyridoxal phosphate-dependent enzyme [Chitinophagales bacterium]|jgi:hypothetical protein|nr:YggS family pyridoxal phosphate-dependent enzyme [Chitinophagales bacterium]